MIAVSSPFMTTTMSDRSVAATRLSSPTLRIGPELRASALRACQPFSSINGRISERTSFKMLSSVAAANSTRLAFQSRLLI